MCTSANNRSPRGSAVAGLVVGVAAMAALASGCSLAPRYSPPAVEAPPAYREVSSSAPSAGAVWKQAEPRDDAPRGNWWEAFGDEQLNGYEARLSSANQNVAAAASAFLAARAAVALTRSQYFPSITAAPSVARTHVSAATLGPTANTTFTEYTLPFDASWQPDFWGKTRNAVAANVFAAQASEADLENVRLTAHAELAVNYYQLRAQDELQVLLSSAVVASGEALSLSETLNRSGLNSDQDVARAQEQLGIAQAQAANAGILRAQYEHAIATLLGVPSSSFSISSAPFLAPSPDIPAGVPSELLERRPDIASSERAVAGANARIGLARAAYFPSLTLNASGGYQSFSAADWLTWPSRFWSLGATAAETLFDAGLRRAATRQARALYEETVAGYRQTVLTAFQQVEDALAAVRISSEDVKSQQEAVEAGTRNLEEARARYSAGLSSDLEVTSAETSLISLGQIALAYRIQQVVAQVRLIEALGGGWNASRLPTKREVRR